MLLIGNLFLNFMQTLGDKYHTNTHNVSTLTSKSPSVDQLNLLSQVSAAATATALHHPGSYSNTHTATAEAFMTIDDVISSKVTQDFSSFSMSDVKVPSPFNNFNSGTNTSINVGSNTNSSKCLSVLSGQSPLLLSNPDLVSLNTDLIMMPNKEALAISHTSVQGIEHLDRFEYNKTSGSMLVGGIAESAVVAAPIFVDQSQSVSNTVESIGGFEDSNFF